MTIQDWENVDLAFRDGKIASCDTATLQAHLIALSNQQIHNDTIQHRDIIRGITINNLLLQRHIENINRKNTITQWLVIVLAIASLAGTVTQIYMAIPQSQTNAIVTRPRPAAITPVPKVKKTQPVESKQTSPVENRKPPVSKPVQ